LRPLEKISQLTLFAVTSVGFLAIVAIPARIGELARPFLISRKSNISMSSALSTIVIERVFDSFSILLIFALTFLWMPFPAWVVRSGIFFLGLTLALLAVVALFLLKKDTALRWAAPLLDRIPEHYQSRVTHFIDQFISGFKTMSNPWRLFGLFVFSIFIWLTNSVTIYLMFGAFGLKLSYLAALVTLVILLIGIAIPAAPGFIGNWHFACVLALGLFAVGKAEALTYAIVYHFLSIALVVILGLAFLPLNRFSMSDLRKALPASK
ncbi:MAG: lysylphosphatidylglycerol synthase transmembrane domain-containing protein, partial [Syntrophales bacterium]